MTKRKHSINKCKSFVFFFQVLKKIKLYFVFFITFVKQWFAFFFYNLFVLLKKKLRTRMICIFNHFFSFFLDLKKKNKWFAKKKWKQKPGFFFWSHFFVFTFFVITKPSSFFLSIKIKTFFFVSIFITFFFKGIKNNLLNKL